MPSATTAPPESIVAHDVASVCSVCRRTVTARVQEVDGQIWMTKRCPTHGQERVLESRTTAFYHRAPFGCETAPGCCEPRTGSNAAPRGRNEPAGPTCVGLLEITDACNLECPVCYAASGPAGDRWHMPLHEVDARLTALIERRGPVDILMLSGGEPTVHPDFATLLARVQRRAGIGRIMLNTNGLALARPSPVRDAVLAARSRLEIYLQLDSLRPVRTATLRGAPGLLETKIRALDWLTDQAIPTTFAVALQQDTSPAEVGELLALAIDRPNVRGCTFQPVFASGRHAVAFDPRDRLTTPDAVRLICAAQPSLFDATAFANLPCSHPNCAIVAYWYRASGRLWPLRQELVPTARLNDRINFTLDDLRACGCETTELGRYVRDAELSTEHSFRVVVKPFMDRFNLNRDRTAQCCTHVIGPGGKLMSFCEYNVFRDRLRWNRSGGATAVNR